MTDLEFERRMNPWLSGGKAVEGVPGVSGAANFSVDKLDAAYTSVRDAGAAAGLDPTSTASSRRPRAVRPGAGPGSAPLGFGSRATGWVLNSTNAPGEATVRLYVPCDVEAPKGDSDQPAPRYFGVLVSGDVVHGASPAKAHQAYADIALKVGRAAVTA
ncbi:hypothetical protein [Kitasatospora sp. NPDC005856]|uniref:hypothetical protein n=1 Tax=Kitasatospora sp. NPDC005856 TaxID=3154566 RepID=UPI0034115E49